MWLHEIGLRELDCPLRLVSVQYKNRDPVQWSPQHTSFTHNLAHSTGATARSSVAEFRLRSGVSSRSVRVLPAPSSSIKSIMAISRAALCVALLLAIASFSSTEAQLAKIETFNGPNCDGTPTNTFYVGGNTCQKFFDQSSVRVSDVSASTRVSVHNQQNCETVSSIGQFYGPNCLTQGATKLRAVWIQG